MTNAQAILFAVVWLSVVGLAALILVQKAPKRRKPVDELEAADAALRLQIIDLRDKFEHYVKREAVRFGRAKAEEAAGGGQPMLPGLGTDRASRLAAVRERIKAAKGA